jgi:polar amino acid transport system ATP-binding protein
MESRYEPELDKKSRNEPVLRIVDVWKSYKELQVLKGVSFEVEEKEVKVVFGPSGSGKSTLLRCINMLTPPDKGEVYLSGKNLMESGINLNKERAKIGMVFQHFNLFSHLKAIDNVAIGLRRVRGLPKDEAKVLALNALNRVKMAEWADHYPAQLSGGQQQRVGIARALAMEPDVILFDEPTSALDPELIGEVLQTMLEIAKSGTTMVVVTHEMGFASAVASEMIFIDKGIVIERGTPQHFFETPKSERVKYFLKQIEVLYGHHKELLDLEDGNTKSD